MSEIILDLGLAGAILREGSEGWRQYLEQEIDLPLIDHDYQELFSFLYDYAESYDGQVPSTAVITANFPSLEIPDVKEPVAFFADYVKKRALHGGIQNLITEAGTSLKNQKPEQAYDTLALGLQKLRADKLVDTSIKPVSAYADEWAEYHEKIASGWRGIPTPWPTVNDATLGLWPGDLIVLAARSGIGKCVEESTLITDPVTGIPRTIKEIYEGPTSMVHTWSKEKGIHAIEITQKVDTGYKDCLEITTSTGRKIVVTPEHPFLTPMGWKKAEELGVGSSLALPERTPEPTEPVPMPEAEVDALALLLAEGSYTGKHVGFSTTDNEILRIANAVADQMGTHVKHRSGVDYDFVPETPVRNMLKRLGVDKTPAKNKTLPKEVFQLPNKQLARFISVFWMCDGYVQAAPEMCLASKGLLEQFQSLLLRFGIQSRLSYKKTSCEGKPFDAWRLRVYSKYVPVFRASFNLWGNKLANLDKLCKKKHNSNVGFPRVDQATEDQITTKLLADTAKRDALRDVWGCTNLPLPRDLVFKGNVRTKLQDFCRVYEVKDYDWWYSSEIFWGQVVEIKSVGRKKIYDLTVEPTSCFVANDIIVHNTWAALMFALSAWQAGKTVLFATTELTQFRVSMRLFCLMAGLTYKKYLQGKLDLVDKQRMFEAREQFKQMERFFLIGGSFDFRPETLHSAIYDIKPDLAIFDGGYLLKTAGANRTEQAANAFNTFKPLALKAGIPVVVTTQFNRGVKTNQIGTVDAGNVALTDAALWNADIMLALWQDDDMFIDKVMKVLRLKSRETMFRDFLLRWDFDTMEFGEIPDVIGDAHEGLTQNQEDDDTGF